MTRQPTGNKISRVWEGKNRDVRRNVTTGNAIHPVRGQVRIIRLRGPRPGLQELPIVTHPRNTMLFDGKRVERIRGLPCRDNIGEFATLEGRLENEQKRFKGITFINYNNNESGTSVSNKAKQAKNRRRNNYCPPGGGIRGRGRGCG